MSDKVEQHRQHEPLDDAEGDNPGQYDGKCKQVPFVKHEPECERGRRWMFGTRDYHAEHGQRDRESAKDDHHGMGSCFPGNVCRRVQDSHQGTRKNADNVAADKMAGIRVQGARHRKSDECARAEGSDQHRLCHSVEHEQQDQNRDAGKPALQCVAFETLAPKVLVKIHG